VQPLFSDTIVYESPLVRIGAFRCHREYPNFRDTGPAQNDCFVFPRTAVQIEHEGAAPFVANPNTVTFYNKSQCYVRHPISERGDECDWFSVRRESGGEAPFRRHRGLCDAKTYLLQRRLFDAVSCGSLNDAMTVEETVLLLLDRVNGAPAAVQRSVRARSVVHEAECLLAGHFEQDLDLSTIANRVGVSAYHLCRLFREYTGFAVHQYLRQLRIRHGLERVCESEAPLSRIAVDLGFTHHSHFTSAFRRDFGITPSELRRSQQRCRRLDMLNGNVQIPIHPGRSTGTVSTD